MPFLLALRSAGTRGALGLGFLFGELFGGASAGALAGGISGYFLQPVWVGWVAAALVFACVSALYTTAFGWAYRALAIRRVAALPLLAAAAWTAMELARGSALPGSPLGAITPWGLLGYTQVGFDRLCQVASLTGVYGVSFLVALMNASLAESVWAVWTRRSLRSALANLTVAGLLTLAALAYGQTALDAARSATSSEPVGVAVVQGNVDLGSRWRPEFFGRNLDGYLKATLQAIAAGPPDVVFWPENALTFHLEEEPIFRRAIAAVLAAGNVDLLVGGPSATSSDPPDYHSSVFLIDASGQVTGRYDKQLLVPFAESVPIPGLDFIRRSFGAFRSFVPGKPGPPLETRAGRAGILICNEAMFPALAAARTRAGAAYLVNPSHDTWIPERAWARMWLDLARFRAIEQRRYLVRPSTSGYSAIVDPWGRIRIRSEFGQREVLLGGVHPRTGLSVYARIGDLFAGTCAGSVLLALAWGRALSPETTTPGDSSRRHPITL